MLARRRFLSGGLALTCLGLLTGCGTMQMPGQRASSVRRIGYLEAGTNIPRIHELRAGMHELGYVEGQTHSIEYRNAEGSLERLPALAAELVELRVEVIVGSNNPAFIAASQATSTIPIVAAGGNIVATGLVTNVARPGGNITGVSTNATELYGKWVDLLKEAVPGLSRLAAIVDLTTGGGLRWVEPAARTLRLRLTPYDLRDLNQLPTVLSMAKDDGADGLAIVSGGVLGGAVNPSIGTEVLRVRLPAIAESQYFALNGGLMAFGANTAEFARRSATYVDKILRGARPGDLPIEQPNIFDLAVNLRTAQALGLNMPQSVLAQATEIIE